MYSYVHSIHKELTNDGANFLTISLVYMVTVYCLVNIASSMGNAYFEFNGHLLGVTAEAHCGVWKMFGEKYCLESPLHYNA